MFNRYEPWTLDAIVEFESSFIKDSGEESEVDQWREDYYDSIKLN